MSLVKASSDADEVAFYWSPDTENKICKIGRRLGFHHYYPNNWQQFFVHVCNGRLGMEMMFQQILPKKRLFVNFLPCDLLLMTQNLIKIASF